MYDLRTQLNRLGAATLTRLIGEEHLESLSNILRTPLTNSAFVNILINRHGNRILDNKEVRAALITSLPDDDISELSDNSKIENVNQLRIKLGVSQWGRTRKFSSKFLELFNIDPEEYFDSSPPELTNVETIGPEKPLFPYQRRLKYSALDILKPSNSRVLIHMPTGAGKTRTASEVLIDIIRQDSPEEGMIIWLAHTEELCEQAFQTLKEVWCERGDQTINIFKLWGAYPTLKVEDLSKKGIVVASLQKAYSISVSQSNERFAVINFLRQYASTIVIDEAHKAIAETYQSIIEALTNIDRCRVVGLTATPGRSYDPFENQELANFFSSQKLTIVDETGNQATDPIRYLQDNGYLAEVERKVIKTDVETKLSQAEVQQLNRLLEIPESVLNRLADNDLRNAVILGEIAVQNNENNKIIVFACSVEHAHLIRELCTFKGIPAHCVDGSTPTDLRRKYIEDYKNGEVRVLVNCQVLTTGFDAPGTNVVMITRPTLSVVLYSQMVGRGIRGPKMGGVENCLIIDLEDNLGATLNANQAFQYFDSSWG